MSSAPDRIAESVVVRTDEDVIRDEWEWWSLMQSYPRPLRTHKGYSASAWREAREGWRRVLAEVRRRDLFDRLRWP